MTFLRLGVVVLATVLLVSGCGRNPSDTEAPRNSDPKSNSPQTAATVDLSADQIGSIKIAPVGTHLFAVEKRGIGTIDFDNKLYFNSDLSTPVYPLHDGTIAKIYVELGDEVQKGQALYAITNEGRSEDVVSPIAGQVTAINTPLGLEVQPGRAPAPCTVADVSSKWVLGSLSEVDGTFVRPGQRVEIRVMAYPGRVFTGKVSRLYATIDPNTHRASICCEISDPENVLRSGMLATFTVQVQPPAESMAIPADGVVHEGDGTLAAWVTTDRRHFTQQTITIGLQDGGMDQVLSGLQPGELVVADGAIFLSNMLEAPPSD